MKKINILIILFTNEAINFFLIYKWVPTQCLFDFSNLYVTHTKIKNLFSHHKIKNLINDIQKNIELFFHLSGAKK